MIVPEVEFEIGPPAAPIDAVTAFAAHALAAADGAVEGAVEGAADGAVDPPGTEEELPPEELQPAMKASAARTRLPDKAKVPCRSLRVDESAILRLHERRIQKERPTLLGSNECE